MTESEKGLMAVEWSIKDWFVVEPFYFVMLELSYESESESQDRQRRMWVIRKDKAKTTRPIFIGTRDEAIHPSL